MLWFLCCHKNELLIGVGDIIPPNKLYDAKLLHPIYLYYFYNNNFNNDSPFYCGFLSSYVPYKGSLVLGS